MQKDTTATNSRTYFFLAQAIGGFVGMLVLMKGLVDENDNVKLVGLLLVMQLVFTVLFRKLARESNASGNAD